MSADLEIRTGGALAVTGEQTEWTGQQLAVLRSAGVSEEVTPAELAAFLHECQRTKLDPFTRQIYLIGRYDTQAKRKVFRSQTGIDGYRVIAHRVIRDEAAELEYDDTLWCGPDGVWRDVWLSQDPPAAAKVTVRKNGRAFPAVATLAEYAARYPDGNPYPMWRRMPSNQLAKCAEALALRKAFPQDLAGIYTAEEMDQADARDQAPQVEQTPRQFDDAQIVPEAASEPQAPRMVSDGQLRAVHALLAAKFSKRTDEERHAGFSKFTGRTITSASELTHLEASNLIDAMSKMPDHVQDPEQPAPVPVARTEAADGNANFKAAEQLLKLERQQGGREAEELEQELRDAIESAGSPNDLAAAMSDVVGLRDAGRIDGERFARLAAAADERAARARRELAGVAA